MPVKITLTLPQANALRDLLWEGWAGHEVNDEITPVMERAVTIVEDAMEKAQGGTFQCRISQTTHPQPKETHDDEDHES